VATAAGYREDKDETTRSYSGITEGVGVGKRLGRGDLTALAEAIGDSSIVGSRDGSGEVMLTGEADGVGGTTIAGAAVSLRYEISKIMAMRIPRKILVLRMCL
jgi:hypothetical protein